VSCELNNKSENLKISNQKYLRHLLQLYFLQKPLLAIACIIQVVLLASCGVPKNFEHAVYLKDSITEAAKTVVSKPTVIMPGDRLSIDITAINKEAAQAFNAPLAGSAQGVQGYLVDSLGNILLLQLGEIHVAGLTPPQLEASLQQQLVDYIKGPVVTVSIANFKVHMLGEVGSPGTLTVPEGKINILQAITQSGDLTLFGKRENILVIREENGKREFGRLDLSSHNIFESPFFNLQQNDVVYVEPDKTKFISNDVIMNRNIRNLSLFLTLISTVLLLQSLFK